MPAFAPPYDDDLELLRSTAVAAGIIASSYFRRDIKTWTKDNASPVSEADIVVDRFLAANLLQARPSYGWLSEETVDNPSRLDCERVFVVDPIDGTRAFLRGKITGRSRWRWSRMALLWPVSSMLRPATNYMMPIRVAARGSTANP